MADKIKIFRVFSNGISADFDNLDVALHYSKAQINKGGAESLAIETWDSTREEYNLAVEKQESKQ